MSSTSALSVHDSHGEVATPTHEAEAVSTRGLRLKHLWAIVPFAIAWFASSIDFIEPYDFWWNVKSGQIMAETGQFLARDVLVWSPVREPYYNPQWGSQLLFYWLYAVSPYLLLTVRALIIAATVGLILWLSTWRSRTLQLSTLATVIAYLASWTNYGVRPQLFAFLPFVGFYFLLERKDSYPRWLPLLVPIMLFWVNVHGSFFLGLAMLGIYGLGTVLEKIGSSDDRKWLTSRAALWQAGWLVAAALTSLANPYFTEIYNYFFVATNDPIARAINIEWQSPTIYDGTGQLFFANVLIFAATLYASRRRLRPIEILLVLAFGYLSLTSLRNAMWWNWLVAPMTAVNLATWAANRRHKREEAEQFRNSNFEIRNKRELPAMNWLLAILMVGGALAFTPLWRPSNPLVAPAARTALAPDTPTKVAEFLKTGSVPSPVFNYMEWGGYLENELYPRYQMFIDGRFEARQVPVWNDYLSVSRARADWQQTLDRYGVRTLVLSKQFHKDLIPFVTASPTWHPAYDDKNAIVFVR
ncbi:MAG: hypothetical protein QOH93_3595 [Chloroflexia bacterium]|jgi:hypothetical protein|nr:hypothetical protein [Chloroflexia bacterium]